MIAVLTRLNYELRKSRGTLSKILLRRAPRTLATEKTPGKKIRH
jgi:hypothetical protein